MLVWAPAFTGTLGKSLSLQKASSHSYDSDVGALTAFPLLGPSSHPQTLYLCEMSLGLQGSPKQVPQAQDGAHQAALGDVKSASLSLPLVGKEGHETCRTTALPRSPHLSSNALLPLRSDGCEVPGGAAPQLPLPSKTD